jgi:hypothetical protein
MTVPGWTPDGKKVVISPARFSSPPDDGIFSRRNGVRVHILPSIPRTSLSFSDRSLPAFWFEMMIATTIPIVIRLWY